MAGGYILFVFSYSLLEGSWGNIVDIFTLDSTGHIQMHRDDYVDKPKIYKSIQDTQKSEAAIQSIDAIKSYTSRVFRQPLRMQAIKPPSHA